MTALEVTNRMRADKCLTASRSRSKKKNRNYSNKYTTRLGMLGYKGIRKDGYFSKIYSYGVVGHCCIFVQYWLILCGLRAFVPKKGYIWNTNQYAKWLKTQPTIKGYGKVTWTTNPKKAKLGAVCFKGQKGHSSYTHTCVFLKYEKGYIYTVDGNVTSTYKGKKINNGSVKKRKIKDFRWGFANLPYPKPKPVKYTKGETYMLQRNMNIREKHSTKSKVLGTMQRGQTITPKEVYTTKNGVVWLKIMFKEKTAWVCAKTAKNLYIK